MDRFVIRTPRQNYRSVVANATAVTTSPSRPPPGSPSKRPRLITATPPGSPKAGSSSLQESPAKKGPFGSRLNFHGPFDEESSDSSASSSPPTSPERRNRSPVSLRPLEPLVSPIQRERLGFVPLTSAEPPPQPQEEVSNYFIAYIELAITNYIVIRTT